MLYRIVEIVVFIAIIALVRMIKPRLFQRKLRKRDEAKMQGESGGFGKGRGANRLESKSKGFIRGHYASNSEDAMLSMEEESLALAYKRTHINNLDLMAKYVFEIAEIPDDFRELLANSDDLAWNEYLELMTSNPYKLDVPDKVKEDLRDNYRNEVYREFVSLLISNGLISEAEFKEYELKVRENRLPEGRVGTAIAALRMARGQKLKHELFVEIDRYNAAFIIEFKKSFYNAMKYACSNIQDATLKFYLANYWHAHILLDSLLTESEIDMLLEQAHITVEKAIELHVIRTPLWHELVTFSELLANYGLDDEPACKEEELAAEEMDFLGEDAGSCGGNRDAGDRDAGTCSNDWNAEELAAEEMEFSMEEETEILLSEIDVSIIDEKMEILRM